MTLLLDLSIHNASKTFLISHSNFILPIKQESRETEKINATSERFWFHRAKVKKILKGSLDLIPSLSPSV